MNTARSPGGRCAKGCAGTSRRRSPADVSAELAAAAPKRSQATGAATGAAAPDGQLDGLVDAIADAEAQAAQNAEAAAELRDLLDRLLIEHLKAQETEALASAATDPAAIDRYRMINARRLSLKSVVKTT